MASIIKFEQRQHYSPCRLRHEIKDRGGNGNPPIQLKAGRGTNTKYSDNKGSGSITLCTQKARFIITDG